MTTYRGHYLPVAARRQVLKIYRDRRQRPLSDPLRGRVFPPLDAMEATVEYFQGWLAQAVAFGPVGRESVESLTHQLRAAEFYRDRMYAQRAKARQKAATS